MQKLNEDSAAQTMPADRVPDASKTADALDKDSETTPKALPVPQSPQTAVHQVITGGVPAEVIHAFLWG